MGENLSAEDLTKALAGAAKGGHAALCRRLIEAGALVNKAVGGDENTPLAYALKSGSSETIEILKRYGA
jgi:ankyrin repeat protein